MPWDDANNPKICDHGRPIIIQLEQPTDLRIKKTDFNCLLNTDKKWLEIQDSYFELLLRRCELGTCPTILIDTNLFDEFGNRDENECFVNTKTKQTMLYISYGYVNFFGVGSLGIVCDSFPFGYISDSPIYSPVDKDTIFVKPGSYFALDENNGILLPLGGMKYNFVAGNCENKVMINAQANCGGIKKDITFCSGEITDVCGDGRFKLVPTNFPGGITMNECYVYEFTLI